MELRDYLDILRARKWVVIQAVVIVALAALTGSLLETPVYESEARVLISERDSGAAVFGNLLPEFSSQPERGLLTQAELVQGRPIAETVIQELGLEMSPAALQSRIDVAAVGETNIIAITVRDSDPERAAAVANSVGTAFVDFSRDIQRESLQAAIVEVEARLAEARAEVLDLGQTIEAEGLTDELAAGLDIATGQYTTLADRLAQLQITEQLEEGTGRVVSPAVVSDSPVSPKPLRSTVLGAVVGLVLGIALAFFFEHLDDTIRSGEELSEIYGAPSLGLIPYHEASRTATRELVVRKAGASREGEAYRMLRNALEFINFEHDINTLLITSAVPEEGKSTVAANMAANLAQAGANVAFVCCDFRRPTSHEFFGVPNTVGLSDVLLGRSSLSAALQEPEGTNLRVLTAGKLPPNPAELLGSARMQGLVGELREWADWIIIDSPPLLAVADAAAVARWVDGVLVVSRAQHATRDAALRAAEQLAGIGARVAGVVTTASLDDPAVSGRYYGYRGGYRSYHGYYAAEDGGPDDSSEDAARRLRDRARGRASLGEQLLTGALSFVVVLMVLTLVAFALDALFGWGLADALRDLF